MNEHNKKEEEYIKIEKWLIQHNIEDYSIDKDLAGNYIINVYNNVDISNNNLKELPFKFGTVTGFFNASNNLLTSLKNCPDQIGWNMSVSNNLIETLEHFPKNIGFYTKDVTPAVGLKNALKYLDITNNKISSFESLQHPLKFDGKIHCDFEKNFSEASELLKFQNSIIRNNRDNNVAFFAEHKKNKIANAKKHRI